MTRLFQMPALGRGVAPIILLTAFCASAVNRPASVPPAEHFGRLPLYFEANQGQSDPRVQFLARSGGGAIYLGAADATLVLEEKAGVRFVRFSFAGANAAVVGAGEEKLAGRVNYLLGDDPSRWQRGVPTFRQVRYEQVFSGVDLVFHANEQELEYDFHLAPGSDPSDILLQVAGADRLEINLQGDLFIHAGARQLRQHKPAAWQIIDGVKRDVPVRYELKSPRAVAFAVGRYDHNQPLIIDPVLSYSTYLGGTALDEAWAVAVDGAGNAYVAGETRSILTNVPVAGFQTNLANRANTRVSDAFIARVNPAGAGFDYLTYLGGRMIDAAVGLAVDPAGNAYITGFTDSTNFPTTPGVLRPRIPATNTFGYRFHFADAFVAKLDPSGSTLLYSTLLGGLDNDGATAIAIDASGCAYVTGYTESKDFPTTNAFTITNIVMTTNGMSVTNIEPMLQTNRPGLSSAFVAKLNPTGTALIYSTYLGGSRRDRGNGIGVDASGNAYVAGYTFSDDFPVTNAIQPTFGGERDAFVTKFAPTGAVVYSTYLGGSRSDTALHLVTDDAGNSYVCGSKASSDFPTTAGLNHGGLFRSTDAAASWNAAYAGIEHNNIQALAVDPGNALNLFVGTPRGIFESSDGGVTWVARNSGIPHRNVTALALDPLNPATVYAGTQDALYKSTNSGVNWTTNRTGLRATRISALAVVPAQPSTLFAGTRGGGIFRSTDAATTWHPASSGLSSLLIHAVAPHPTDPSVLYAATGAGIFKSTNGGAHWRASSTGLTTRKSQALVIDPLAPDILYAGTSRGLFKSTDAGTNWAALGVGLGNSNITALAIDPATPATLYAGTTNGLFKSVDAGMTWTTNNFGLSKPRIAVLAVAATDPATVYAGLIGTNGFGGTNDAFVLKLSADGATVNYSVILGGSRGDEASGIAVDGSGNAYVAGATASTNFAVLDPPAARQSTNSGRSDAFVTALDPTGSSLLYSFYFGAKKNDYARAIAVDDAGNAYVVGRTDSTNFPLAGPIQATYGGKGDAFIAKFSTMPMLRIEPAGAVVRLKWAASAPGYLLETCERFGGIWTPVSQKPALANGWNTITIPAAPTCRFFRLNRRD